MKRMISIEHWWAAGALIGALALAIVSPALALWNLKAAHGAARPWPVDAGGVLAAVLIFGAAALAIDLLNLALRGLNKRMH